MINVHDAKSNLSRLLDRAATGEEIIIGRAGKPVARLVALGPRRRVEFGRLKGQIWISDDFDAIDQDLIDSFEGNPPRDDASTRHTRGAVGRHR